MYHFNEKASELSKEKIRKLFVIPHRQKRRKNNRDSFD